MGNTGQSLPMGADEKCLAVQQAAACAPLGRATQRGGGQDKHSGAPTISALWLYFWNHLWSQPQCCPGNRYTRPLEPPQAAAGCGEQLLGNDKRASGRWSAGKDATCIPSLTG